MFRLLRLLQRQVVKRSSAFFCVHSQSRSLSDTPKTEVSSKQVVVGRAQLHGTENEQRVRVRRARPSDVPRVLRFVRDNARAWPGGARAAEHTYHLVLSDYVARALAQGHSMLAEQHESRRGWLQIRGLALSAGVCAWDAAILERWARCVECPRSRRVLHFSAHCLRAPKLHDKYHVHNILQVILIVPPDTPRNAEIIQVLAKNAIQRGRDVGFPLLRFDVTTPHVSQALENLNLTKEWSLRYEILPEGMFALKEPDAEPAVAKASGLDRHFIAVYSAPTREPSNP